MPQALRAAWALLSAPSAGWPWGVELLRALWVAASSVSDDPVGAYLWWAGVVWSATAYVCLTFAVICAVVDCLCLLAARPTFGTPSLC